MSKRKAKHTAKPTKQEEQVWITTSVSYFDPTTGLLHLEEALGKSNFELIDGQLKFIIKKIPSDKYDNYLRTLILFLAKISEFGYMHGIKNAQDYLYSFLQKQLRSEKELLYQLFSITLYLKENHLTFPTKSIELPLFGRHRLIIDILRVLTENPASSIVFSAEGFKATYQVFISQLLSSQLIPLEQREQIVKGLLKGLFDAKDVSEMEKLKYTTDLKLASGAFMDMDTDMYKKFDHPYFNILWHKNEATQEELCSTSHFSLLRFNEKSGSSLTYTNTSQFLTELFNQSPTPIYLLNLSSSGSFNKYLQNLLFNLLDNKNYLIAFELTRFYEGCIPLNFGEFWYCISLYAKASQWRVDTGKKCWPTLDELQKHDERHIAFSNVCVHNILKDLYQRLAVKSQENSDAHVWLEEQFECESLNENIWLPAFYNLFLDELDPDKIIFSSMLKVIHHQYLDKKCPADSKWFFKIWIHGPQITSNPSYIVPVIHSLTKANLGDQIQDYYKILFIRLLGESSDTSNVKRLLANLDKFIEMITLSADKTPRFYYFEKDPTTDTVYESNIQFFASYPEAIEALRLFIKAYEWRGNSEEIKACQNSALACLAKLDDSLQQYKSKKPSKPQPPTEKEKCKADRRVSAAGTPTFFEEKRGNRELTVSHPSQLKAHVKQKNKEKEKNKKKNNPSFPGIRLIRAMEVKRRKSQKDDTSSVQSEEPGQITITPSSLPAQTPESPTKQEPPVPLRDPAILEQSGAQRARQKFGLEATEDSSLVDSWVEALMAAFYGQRSLTNCVTGIKQLDKEIKDAIFTRFKQTLAEFERDDATHNSSETPAHLKGLELYGTVYYQVDSLLEDIKFYLNQPEFEVLIKELFTNGSEESKIEAIQVLRHRQSQISAFYYVPYLRKLEIQYPANKTDIHQLIEESSRRLKKEIIAYAGLLTEPGTSREYKRWLISTMAIMDDREAHQALNAIKEYIEDYNQRVDESRKVSLGIFPIYALTYPSSDSHKQFKASSDPSHEVATTGLSMQK
jgi:hypothetical protein